MALHTKYQYLMALRPDVAIIPECAEPDILRRKAPEFAFTDCEWSGQFKDKGLGVFSFNGYSLRRHQSWEARFHLFVPIEVCGPSAFNLLAVWAFNHRAPATVSPNPTTTLEAVSHYQPFLTSGAGVVAGDFNANVIWDQGARYASFANLNTTLEGMGLVSAYHTKRDVKLGEELDFTHFWQRNREQLYHIDYAYVPKSWMPSTAEVSVGGVEEWLPRSDHAPLVIDVRPS
jgi:exodeoxyribonuclease-3